MDNRINTLGQKTQYRSESAALRHRGHGVYSVSNGLCSALSVGYVSIAAATPAASKTAKNGAACGSEGGDTACSFSLPAGRLALILSDGMGHDSQASAYSKTAVRVLRDQLRGGVSPALAMRRANAHLCRCAAGGDVRQADAFATIDLVIFDAAKSVAKFYKHGAAPSYILSDSGIKTVRDSSLPAGVFPRMTSPCREVRMSRGQVLLMVSDGVSDVLDYDFCGGGSSSASKLQGLAELLTGSLSSGKAVSPGHLAGRTAAYAMSLGSPFPDDMTVLAMVIEK